jgi:histidine ammonia-lyase
MTPFVLGSQCSLNDLYEVAVAGRKVSLSQATAARLVQARKAMLAYVASAGAVYGVNTGFGELASRRIPGDKCKQLQLNLIRSHACGTGEPMSVPQVRGLMFLRANELARLHSGVRPETVRLLAEFLNNGITPCVPSRGSVGASGDLAPSSHVALALIGENMVRVNGGDWVPADKAIAKAGLKPLVLEEKEGLALINGTQAMQSVGGLALVEALLVWQAATCAAAMTSEALKSTPLPFADAITTLKPHAGQVETGRLLTRLLEDSDIRRSHAANDPRIQDPYSVRCVPQVHGAVRDALEHALDVLEIEMGSATDNPLVIWKDDANFDGIEVQSGGNFHGQPLSLCFDYACAGMVSLGNICERRLFQMVSDTGKILPSFLAKDSGLESGWMITQYTAASLASENKTLAHPASSDSIPTSANKEDFVSMGMWAAHKFGLVVRNTAGIAAVELLASAQGLEFHKPLKPGKGVQDIYAKVRSIAPALEGDASLTGAIEAVRAAILQGYFTIGF